MPRRNDRATEPKDFLAIKGPRALQITPQTSRGWRLLALWIAALLLPHIPLAIWAIRVDETPQEIWVLAALVPLLIVNGLTVWAMIRWTLNRADIVSPEDIRQARRKQP